MYEKSSRYKEMLNCCKESLPLLPNLVQTTIAKYGNFDLSSIPAIEIGCQYWSVMGDKASLEAVRKIVTEVPEIKRGWQEKVNWALDRATLADRICSHISSNPGTIQSTLNSIPELSSLDIREITYYMERVGRIRREKSGSSYKLYMVE